MYDLQDYFNPDHPANPGHFLCACPPLHAQMPLPRAASITQFAGLIHQNATSTSQLAGSVPPRAGSTLPLVQTTPQLAGSIPPRVASTPPFVQKSPQLAGLIPPRAASTSPDAWSFLPI